MGLYISSSTNNKELFTKMNNNIMDSLIISELSGADYRIILSILRGTDPIDRIKEVTITELANMTNLNYDTARKSIIKLKTKRIITQKHNTFSINDTENWDI